MCALATPGTSGAADRSRASPPWYYIRCFTQKCHALPSVADAIVVSAFWDGTTCHTLVHKFNRKQLETIKELLEIATQHASGEEAVGATFALVEEVATAGGGQTATPPSINAISTKKGVKGWKKARNAACVIPP
jgi:hypothetical protein